MAHPKSRTSKQRKRKRRTHKNTPVPQISTCSVTGERHQLHRAYYDADGNLWYRGRMMIRVEEEL